ncbi:MAG: coenzyme F420-0:L-glutamate ligase, partial [Alphaproteobacteria bacterium]|nr:coenzyme F420-0:L-glutamate ligase [Alphaproteobacteria bacterium]
MSTKTGDLQLFSLETLPEISAGDNLATLIVEALSREKRTLADGDIIVVAQKIVSKSEGRLTDLREVVPDTAANELAQKCGKDPRLVSLIMSESSQILRQRDGLIIAVHRRGYVMANAGIDQSNVGSGNDGTALLLPEDPDASAYDLCAG